MGVSVTPPAAVNLADNPKNRLYRATASGTYAVSIPAGVYEVQRQATTNIIIGSTTLVPSTALQVVFINEPQTSITFNSTASTTVVPWVEAPITNNGSGTQYNFRLKYLEQNDMWYTPTGERTQFWTSTDAITWTSRSRSMNTGNSGSMVAEKTAAAGSVRYVEAYFASATNTANYTTRSTDGILWSTSGSRIFDQAGESGEVMIYGPTPDRWLVAGYYWKTGGFYDACLALSTDGATWTDRQAPHSGFSNYQELFSSGTWGNGMFILGTTLGSMRTSTNGLTWTIRNPLFAGNTISQITFGNGRFLAGGANGTLRTSTDAVTWTNIDSGMGTANINNIIYDPVNGQWTLTSTTNGSVRVSTDLVTWVSRSSATGAFDVKAIAYGQGKYVQGYTDTNARSRWFRVPNIMTQMPSVPFTDTYIILEYKGKTRTLS